MTLRVAQIKVYPEKGLLAANHRMLMGVLAEAAAHGPDVVVTPECFLDGYVVTEDSVGRDTTGQLRRLISIGRADPGRSGKVEGLAGR